ncbi:phosphotransferase family protein [Sulfobacillus sp. hq2]|uniref:phosphotransferase family protein n=2 Tax=Sulfobacillus TaxID=28033 RepID=UPI001304B1DF|nr:phosphotransferase [Sulfobacillus sp. hq2]
MSQLHASTMGISPCVRDPGTELVAPTWLEYIRTQSGKWVDIIERHMGRKVTDQLTTLLSLVESQGNPKICLIHRDIRRANIGSRDNSLVLLDYELAIWGDPLWDVGRYLLDCPSRDDFLAGYGMPDSEVLIAYTGLFAFSFAEYLIRHGYNSGEDFKNCVRAIFNGRL